MSACPARAGNPAMAHLDLSVAFPLGKFHPEDELASAALW